MSNKPEDIEMEVVSHPDPEPADLSKAQQPATVQETRQGWWRRMVRTVTEAEDEEEKALELSMRNFFSGDLLARWVRRNVWFVLLLLMFLLIYVSNRYAVQQEMIERDRLTDTLLDRRYKALTSSSQLMERTLRSNIERSLEDSALGTPVEASYVLQVDTARQE